MSANKQNENDEPAAAQGQAAEGNVIGRDLHQVIVNLPHADLDAQVLKQLGLGPPSEDTSIKIVFKGLRSFDEQDSKFFLSLLPGPFDADGLPENIRFWKTQIERTDPDTTFRVGVLFGPSGCGKSSLMKAGLLPQLVSSVIPVVVEATAKDTEQDLLNSLRRHCPNLPPKSSLASTLHKKKDIPEGAKVLIVIDQFEQWLHAHRDYENAELVEALRECDGERVQCVLMVRDDFWTPLSRFFKSLKIEIEGGKNANMVDLFGLDHAKKVLTLFGQAFGKLNAGELSNQDSRFLDEVVEGLSQDGRVICVRLVLLIQMIKDKKWTSATLRSVGGMEGVGAAFLEETFSAKTAPPQYRNHSAAARKVFNALLPEHGTDIKGSMRSHSDLLAASGYANRPSDFEELLRILDGVLRLITPTDPQNTGDPEPEDGAREKYYQLTHDYLVPSLRDWLTRKQRETKKGRAELLLADRATVWNARPENRQLPSFWPWLSILWLTEKKNWTPPQRKMMGWANRYHAVRVSALGLILAVASVAGLAVREKLKATHAAGLVQAVLKADTARAPAIIEDMAEYRRWVDPLLRAEIDSWPENSPQRLHVSLALLPVDATQVEYLYRRGLLDSTLNELPVIRDALTPHKDTLLDRLWAVAEQSEKGKESQRLRAASALAKFDPDNPRWAKVQEAVSNDLVNVPAEHLAAWMEALRPVRLKLLAPLSGVYGAIDRRHVERTLATIILADYAVDQPEVLAELVMDADENQFATIFPKLKDRGEQGLRVLIAEIDRSLPVDAADKAKEILAKRQANAAVALLKLEEPGKAWPLLKDILKHSRDPRARSYLIHRLGPLGADADVIFQRLKDEPDVTKQRALLLSLGEYTEQKLPPEARKGMLPQLQEMYRTASDSGLHASSEWLLRKWQQEAWIKQVNDEWAKDDQQQARRLDGIKQSLRADKENAPRQWYVNSRGQTMVVVPGPVVFAMGSPTSEKGHRLDEPLHRRRINRSFAMAAKPVTLEQYRSLAKDPEGLGKSHTRLPDLPIVYVTWYMAAKYCNLLSEKEKIPEDHWCYVTDKTGQVTRLKENYLSLGGYRLPTEAEMEYATRAGANSSRYYGETDELLGNYAWYSKNSEESIWPVGMKKPNDFGLFDMQGNCFGWCQEAKGDYPLIQGDRVIEDREGQLVVDDGTKDRVVRGGAYYVQPSTVRSASRITLVPTLRFSFYGFRVARTIIP